MIFVFKNRIIPRGMRPESEYCPLEKGAYDLHFVSEKI